MCGLTGFVDLNHSDSESICQQMIQRLHHRGPDHSAIWSNKELGVTLGHARLSILDLSPAGHQPMMSKCGNFVVVFNGEIYNHLELRKELVSSHYHGSWKGHSDTETLLAAFSVWGIKKTLQLTVGMFGLALIDLKSQKLFLARDRMGEKPVYYGWQNGAFLFGSEIKALKAHPKFQNVISRDSLTLLMRHNAISSPHSIYEGIYKLTPGSILSFDLKSKEINEETFWSMKEVVQSAIEDPFSGSNHEALSILESTLYESISGQMLSDGP